MVARSLRYVDKSQSNNDFKISPMIDLNTSQVKIPNMDKNLQAKKLTFGKFMKPTGVLSQNTIKNVEDVSTPYLKTRKSTYHIEKDGVRNIS